jgi:hypothetical protein
VLVVSSPDIKVVASDPVKKEVLTSDDSILGKFFFHPNDLMDVKNSKNI